MSLELRVLTGARAGHRARFDAPTVTIGRHPQNDLQLDPEQDRDVSSRHAEVRVGADGAIRIVDLGSTNGTFVNGERIAEPRALQDGDVVQLGAQGPRLEVRTTALDEQIPRFARDDGGARDDEGRPEPPRRPERSEGPAFQPRPSTTERVAVAVKQETAKLKRIGLAALVLLTTGIGAAYWLGARESAAEVAELRRMLAGYDSSAQLLEQRLRGLADTAVLARLERENAELRTAAAAASKGSGAARDSFRQRVSLLSAGATALAAFDLPTINERNAPAVAFLASEVNGKVLAGTAFAVTSQGLMVTNRHLVKSVENGEMATRLAVKFRDSGEWLGARIVRVASAEDDDLALIQVDADGAVPTVAGISSDPTLREGVAVVTIGYPLGKSTRMLGEGDDFIAKTSLYPGTVSKSLPTVVQIAAYAGHGSSGSPVFDAAGRVAGVVWGGPRESAGQLVYAVPAARLAAFLGQ